MHCFVKDTILFYQNLISNLVIIIDVLAIFVGRIKIGLVLPIISNFVPIGYKWDVKEHVVSKYCHAWRDFKDCVVGRVNSPCFIAKEDIHIIGGY